MKTAPLVLEDCIERTKTARETLRRVQERYRVGQASYEELADTAKAFCAAFDTYHQAKHGKRKKLDWRAVIR